ncbi:MAG: hypothetical protein HQL96_10510 [Magnetococcales bacterium]|nr:hypothetical protein [Magnetococcales bacterium]
MADFQFTLHPISAHPLFWAILFGLVALWAILRFLIIPIQRKRHILQSVAYCPSLLLPVLPKENDVAIFSPSRRLKFFGYRVNLHQLTCSCVRFRRFRGFYPPNDIRRLCRHLRKELAATNLFNEFDELTRALILFRLRDSCYIREPVLNSEAIFGFHPRTSIVRVYTFRKNPDDPPQGPFTGPVDKFTYHHRQEIWIYGTPPPNCEAILTLIAEIMTACKAKYPKPQRLPTMREELLEPIPVHPNPEDVTQIREKRRNAAKTTTPLR